MRLKFTKMQSLGNDFIVLNGVTTSIVMSPSIAQYLADRHFGIGCDQILLAEEGTETDFRFRIFNQDGSEVEQCGNGARCFARFLLDSGLTDRKQISVQTLNTRMQLEILETGDVRVNLGAPIFSPKNVPFLAETEQVSYPLIIDRHKIEISAVSTGNPHAVTLVDDIATASVSTLGPAIEGHVKFPARVNVGFMQVVSRQHIHLRVFERGVGETLGCGSGACAAVIAGIRLGLLDSAVTVSLPGGDAHVEWQGKGEPVYLSGSAHHVFTGEIDIPDAPGAQRTAA